MIFEGKQFQTDPQGYLIDSTIWNEKLAVHIAQIESITLSDEHWQVVHFVRAFYIEFNTSPAMRTLIKALQREHGKDKVNTRYLYRLFPGGPASQATKIAGIPRPARCI
ncbi:MAG: TusE/DsrC/DsvC family sulfur relay protein [Psychromonas sp.]|nr:TusE/DsrC/DsvC family sulfur relay protein [Psychromonas sp.]